MPTCCSSKKGKLQQSKLLPRWHRTLRPMASAILTSRTKKGPILFWAWIALASMCTRRRRGQRSNYIKKHKMGVYNFIFFKSHENSAQNNNHIETGHKMGVYKFSLIADCLPKSTSPGLRSTGFLAKTTISSSNSLTRSLRSLW